MYFVWLKLGLACVCLLAGSIALASRFLGIVHNREGHGFVGLGCWISWETSLCS